MDASVNMQANDNFNQIQPQQEEQRTVVVKSDLSMKDKILEKIKDPLIVTSLAFILNTPVVSNLLAKYLPKLFSQGVSTTIQYVSLLLKSIIIGVLFFALKTIV